MLFLWSFVLNEQQDNSTAADPSVILVIVDGMGPTHIEMARWVEYGATRESFIKAMNEVRALSTQNI